MCSVVSSSIIIFGVEFLKLSRRTQDQYTELSFEMRSPRPQLLNIDGFKKKYRGSFRACSRLPFVDRIRFTKLDKPECREHMTGNSKGKRTKSELVAEEAARDHGSIAFSCF